MGIVLPWPSGAVFLFCGFCFPVEVHVFRCPFVSDDATQAAHVSGDPSVVDATLFSFTHVLNPSTYTYVYI